MDIRRNWWAICLVVVAFAVFCLILPILIWKGQLTVQGVVNISDVVALLRVVLSWPVAIALVGLVFLSRFHAAIDIFLRNIATLKLPGGVEIQTRQLPGAGDAAALHPAGTLVLTPEQQQQINEATRQLEAQRILTAEERNFLLALLRDIGGLAIHWKFRFLDLFYVPITKHVLNWFTRVPAQTRPSFEAVWAPVIPDVGQRETILRVLLEMGMLSEQNGRLQLTQHGYSFLQFIGLIPPVPPPAAS